MKIRISRRWNKLAEEVYRLTEKKVSDWYDFSDMAKEQMFVWESLGRKQFHLIYGIEELPKNNGFDYAKWLLDLTLSMIHDDLTERESKRMEGDFTMLMPLMFFYGDLYTTNADGSKLPEWWVDSIIPEWYVERCGGLEEVKDWAKGQDKLLTYK